MYLFHILHAAVADLYSVEIAEDVRRLRMGSRGPVAQHFLKRCLWGRV